MEILPGHRNVQEFYVQFELWKIEILTKKFSKYQLVCVCVCPWYKTLIILCEYAMSGCPSF